MEKTIYNYIGRGLYVYGTFEKFMEGLEGAEYIQSKCNMDPINYQIWHITPFGVTVQYWKKEKAICDDVKVALYGTEESIGKVEKIILEEAKNH